jgi:Ni,Fe-hydrogenase maturation factor
MRGDDAAALLAADLLPDDARALAEVIEVGQLSVEALLDVPDGVAVIVADAAVGVAGGVVVTLPLDRVAARGTAEPGVAVAGSVVRGAAAPASSHSLPPHQILALAAELRGSLPRGVFVGIGGAEFDFGERLSPLVAAGLASFAATLADEIRRLARA